MNSEILKGNWSQLKGKIKQQWGKLTDNDIQQMNGRYEVLQGRLQELYGYRKEEAEKIIDSFLEKENGSFKTKTEFKH